MATSGSGKPRVLIVDDDGMICSFLRVMLRGDGYDVVGEAHSAEKLVERCASTRAQVVLLDINMPGMDGIKALEALHSAHPGVKVIMISAEATLDRVKEALAKGASGFIVKPFNAATVLDDLARCL